MAISPTASRFEQALAAVVPTSTTDENIALATIVATAATAILDSGATAVAAATGAGLYAANKTVTACRRAPVSSARPNAIPRASAADLAARQRKVSGPSSNSQGEKSLVAHLIPSSPSPLRPASASSSTSSSRLRVRSFKDPESSSSPSSSSFFVIDPDDDAAPPAAAVAALPNLHSAPLVAAKPSPLSAETSNPAVSAAHPICPHIMKKAQDFAGAVAVINQNWNLANLLLEEVTKENQRREFIRALSTIDTYLIPEETGFKIALHFAAEAGQSSIVRILLEANPPSANSGQEYYLPPLNYATDSKNLETISILAAVSTLNALIDNYKRASCLGYNEIAQYFQNQISERNHLNRRLVACELAAAAITGSTSCPLQRFIRNKLFEVRVLGIVAEFCK